MDEKRKLEEKLDQAGQSGEKQAIVGGFWEPLQFLYALAGHLCVRRQEIAKNHKYAQENKRGANDVRPPNMLLQLAIIAVLSVKCAQESQDKEHLLKNRKSALFYEFCLHCAQAFTKLRFAFTGMSFSAIGVRRTRSSSCTRRSLFNMSRMAMAPFWGRCTTHFSPF